jgi:hypothetical protein
MHPTLPLTAASIRDLCESLDYLITEIGYGDKVYLHNTFATHTYNNESLILVDTTIQRTIRLGVTVNVKKSVVIKDITGLAGVNPILVTLIGDGVTLQGSPDREYTLYAPWGSLNLTAHLGDWTVTVPRSTCISLRGFRLPQNLNLVLPPAVGASPQLFDALAFFPANMPGKDTVPATYNGFSAAVHTLSQITLSDPVTSSLTSLFGLPDPPATTGTDFSDLSIVTNTNLAIPSDYADLAAALHFLSNKTIMPGVGVNINLPYASSITTLLLLNHPQAAQITIQGIPPYTFSPANTAVFSSSPGAVLMDVFLSAEDRGNFNVGDILLIDGTTPAFRRWNGAWPVVSTTATSARIQITDWGANYPTATLLPQQSRWRQMKSFVTVTGANSLKIYNDGATINNVAFVGQSNAVNALGVYAEVNLNTVAIVGFTGDGLAAGWRAVLNVNDLFNCSNKIGLRLEREALINGDTNPGSTGVYLNGNSTGLSALNGRGRINPLFAVGNAGTGLFLDKAAVIEVLNSYLQNNASGLSATTNSSALGNTNTITTNTNKDIVVSDGALVKMSSTSALNLGSPNKTLNADGSRIDLF